MSWEHCDEFLPTAALSVSTVSSRLGVSPSTLRTWERRYGLGPTDRQAGTHRRYQPIEIARLHRMKQLISSGVPTAEAAAAVISMVPKDFLPFSPDVEVPNKPEQLVDVAVKNDSDLLHSMITAATRERGLIRTWADLVEPATEKFLASAQDIFTGQSPLLLLLETQLRVLREVGATCPSIPPSEQRHVLIFIDREHLVPAHVIALELQWKRVSASVVTACNADGCAHLTSYIDKEKSKFIIVMGCGALCEHMVDALTSDTVCPIVLLGADTPSILRPGVERVRSMMACVEEVLTFLRE